MAPQVSVIMPIYRPNAEYLRIQLESIDDQDYDDMEIAVLNDDPADSVSEELVRDVVRQHPLRYLRGNRNRGYIKAFEHLVELAQGEYLAFSDQDDRWLPGRISVGLAPLLDGHLLSVCDRQLIDGEGRVVVESWAASHPRSAQDNWKTGERFVSQAVFSCYAIGMGTMVRADVARKLMPFPLSTGHDKWLAMGANALGSCARIDEPLVQYRRHGMNETGRLQGIASKADWYEKRTMQSYRTAQEFVRRFPDCPENGEIMAFAEARKDRNLRGIWKGRSLAPDVAAFETALKFLPNPLFELLFKRN